MANPLKLLKLKATGFQFIEELPIDAPPARVWKALLNIDGWFHFDHDRAKGTRCTLEPWPGGRFMAEADDGTAVLHGIVTHIEPNKLLRMSGPIGMSHLPVSNAFIWELQPKHDGKATLLRFCQRTFGFVDADLRKRYAGGWGKLLPQLKELAEAAPRKRGLLSERKGRARTFGVRPVIS